MRFFLLSIVLVFCFGSIRAQREFHVFPANHNLTPGNKTGDGSLKNPWDLQTALNQTPDIVNGGDTIWLHGGVYSGHFISHIKSTDLQKKIVVQSYGEDKVVLNGSIPREKGSVLTVKGDKVVFKNFEVTCIAKLTRKREDSSFVDISGINHISGEDCEFIGLTIHGNTGLGLGSWKHTGGTIIEACVIFNNGSIDKDGKGRGEGIYTQNKSDKTRVIKNNVIFNNYYKAIEVWSANKHANHEYVKNYELSNNILFNSGFHAGKAYDNLIIATDDRDGINVAKNIKVLGNVLYHNTSIKKHQINGNAPVLTLGFHKGSPVKNVTVKNNWIVGRNNALRILHAESLNFSNNLVYTGYIALQPTYNKPQPYWDFHNNSYFTKRRAAFRYNPSITYDFENWNSKILRDRNSQWNHLKSFPDSSLVKIVSSNYKSNVFLVCTISKHSLPTSIDFSDYLGDSKKIQYEIQNIADESVVKEGVLKDLKILEVPVGNYNGTHTNFSVYRVVFKEIDNKEGKPKTVLGKFFKWLGF